MASLLNDPVSTVLAHYPAPIADAVLAVGIEGGSFADLPADIQAAIEPDADNRECYTNVCAVNAAAIAAAADEGFRQRDAAVSRRRVELLSGDFISTAHLAELLDASRMTISRWRRAGYLPRPVYADSPCTLWSTDTIREWIRGGCEWAHPELARGRIAASGLGAGIPLVSAGGRQALLESITPREICDPGVGAKHLVFDN